MAELHVAVLTFEGFNELDSFIASAMLNRVKQPQLRAMIVCPDVTATSMNGVVVHSQAPIGFAREADAVIVGSGVRTREIVQTPAILRQLSLDPARQIIAAQCSGALVLAKLGLLAAASPRTILPPGSSRGSPAGRRPRPWCTTSRRSGRSRNTSSAHAPR